MSADFHKYGYTPRGASLLALRDGEDRRFQGFKFSNWQTGTFDTPGLSLAPPTISSELLDLVAAAQEVENVRQSGIRVSHDADDAASHDEEPPTSATG